MSNFKVLWSEGGSDERHSRKFETAEEARGFIKGLRVSKDNEKIVLQVQSPDGRYAKTKIADFFLAMESEAQH